MSAVHVHIAECRVVPGQIDIGPVVIHHVDILAQPVELAGVDTKPWLRQITNNGRQALDAITRWQVVFFQVCDQP